MLSVQISYGPIASLMALLDLIQQQIGACGDAIAVTTATECVTFRELQARADAYAEALLEAQISEQAVVAVLMDRSPSFVAALLGIWEAGAAYLPIDPTTPSERLAFLLKDSGAIAMIAAQKYVSLVPPKQQLAMINADGVLSRSWPPHFPRQRPLSTDQLAYVLYTSGSTGRPKGVEVCHGGLSNVVSELARQLELKRGEVLLAHSSPGFDVSNLEIFLPLVSGGSVHIAEAGATGNGGLIARLLEESKATTALGTASFWQVLLNAGWKGRPDFRVISGGEVLSHQQARELARRCAAVWNHYGPTEATICTSTARIDAATEKVTIGHPLPNTTVHVLDSDRQPVAPGSAGELYIGGAGVARSYRNRPDLTAASFFEDTFDCRPGARLYKTGDLGRSLPDGSLEFLGRIDSQVKIRGYRIELEEIEEHLREAPGVSGAALSVVNREGGQRLVAWIASEHPIPAAVLREFLRKRVPAYMIPSEFRAIGTLPLNASGKLDRKTLREQAANCAVSELPVTPRNGIEAILIEIWEELLGRRVPSVNESFFDLGGDSLLAALLVMRIEEQYGRNLAPDTLVQYSSIRALAGLLEHVETHSASETFVPLRAEGSRTPLFIIPGLGGTALLFRLLSGYLGEDQPVYVLRLPAGIIYNHNDTRIEDLASRYVRELRAIFPSGPYHLCGHSFGGLIAFQMAIQLRSMGAAVGLLGLIDSDRHVGRSHLNKSMDGISGDRRSPVFGMRRARAKFESLMEKGLVEVIRRRAGYLKLKHRIKLAEKALIDGIAKRDFEAKELLALAAAKYHPALYPGNATLFRAGEHLANYADPTLGWKDRVTGRLDVIDIPGTHLSMFDEPNVRILAEEVTEYLADLAWAA